MCIYPYKCKFQSPSKYSPFDAIYLSRLFPTAQNSFWTCCFWCLLVVLLFFLSLLPHRQNVSLWGPFFRETNRKSNLGWDVVNREGGHGGHAIFGQKLLNTQCSVGRCACKSPIMKWANTWRVFKKNSLKLNADSHNNTS